MASPPVPLLALFAGLALVPAAAAQTPFQGNGLGQAFFGHTTARIGGTIEAHMGSPAAPGGFAVVAFSDGLGPTNETWLGLGLVGLDLMSPMLTALTIGLDGSGQALLQAPIQNLSTLAQMPPVYAAVGVLEPTQISVSKTTRIVWTNPDSSTPGGLLLTGRVAHTATALGAGPDDPETRVLVIGGGNGTVLVPLASRTTELYSPLTHSATVGPQMSFDRALHQTVRLQDGRVLVCGGLDSLGVVTASAEVWDPATGQFAVIAPMQQPRAGHAATLLGNGKVLVTGGLANYQNPLQNLAAVLNTAQDTAELFDPATGNWSAVPGNTGSRRSGHAHTLLPDGRVLVSGGIQGGVTTPLNLQIPVYTTACSVYDPVANAFVPTGAMQVPRAFHGTSVLGTGDVLVTGGSISSFTFSVVGATNACERWDGTAFTTVGNLATPMTNHVQFTAADGRAVVLGGLTGIFPNLVGTAETGRHDGTALVVGNRLGTNPGLPGATPLPRGAMVGVPLFDGSIALLGGSDGIGALVTTLLFTP